MNKFSLTFNAPLQMNKEFQNLFDKCFFINLIYCKENDFYRYFFNLKKDNVRKV